MLEVLLEDNADAVVHGSRAVFEDVDGGGQGSGLDVFDVVVQLLGAVLPCRHCIVEGRGNGSVDPPPTEVSRSGVRETDRVKGSAEDRHREPFVGRKHEVTDGLR